MKAKLKGYHVCELTNRLRFVERELLNGKTQKVLQQGWCVLDSFEIEWRDVPLESE